MFKFHLTAGYIDEEVYIEKRTYTADGSTMLQLRAASDGAPIAVATVCVAGEKPESGNVFIKDWSENVGILEALQVAGVIGPVIREVPTGFIKAQECKLLVEV